MRINDAETCLASFVPKLYRVGWEDKPILRLPSGRTGQTAADLYRVLSNIGDLPILPERHYAVPKGRC
jgi:hypothetical protein